MIYHGGSAVAEIKQKSRLMLKFESLKNKARKLKKEIRVLYLACRRPDTPWYAKLSGAVVIGYALSPIDLIPDFIPILGYLDDLLLIPLGIWLTIRLIPQNILAECRIQAEDVFGEGKPKNWIAASIIVLIWVLLILVIINKFMHIF